ncbi:hypothetical protein U3516DRAFT_910626 [Neocallimastix sp. 'constans']
MADEERNRILREQEEIRRQNERAKERDEQLARDAMNKAIDLQNQQKGMEQNHQQNQQNNNSNGNNNNYKPAKALPTPPTPPSPEIPSSTKTTKSNKKKDNSNNEKKTFTNPNVNNNIDVPEVAPVEPKNVQTTTEAVNNALPTTAPASTPVNNNPDLALEATARKTDDNINNIVPGSSKDNTGISTFGLVALVAVAVICCTFFILRKRRRNRENEKMFEDYHQTQEPDDKIEIVSEAEPNDSTKTNNNYNEYANAYGNNAAEANYDYSSATPNYYPPVNTVYTSPFNTVEDVSYQYGNNPDQSLYKDYDHYDQYNETYNQLCNQQYNQQNNQPYQYPINNGIVDAAAIVVAPTQPVEVESSNGNPTSTQIPITNVVTPVAEGTTAVVAEVQQNQNTTTNTTNTNSANANGNTPSPSSSSSSANPTEKQLANDVDSSKAQVKNEVTPNENPFTNDNPFGDENATNVPVKSKKGKEVCNDDDVNREYSFITKEN